MAIEFKDAWPETFYEDGRGHRKIPSAIEDVLFRKLQMLDAATREADLRAPPGNRFEHLSGRLSGWCSIRVNRQYRLIFQRTDGAARDTYLDPHTYGG